MEHPEIIERLARIEAHVLEIQRDVAGNAEWRIGVDRRLMDHNLSIEKLKAWQFKLIGAYLGAAVLCGVAFQFILATIG